MCLPQAEPRRVKVEGKPKLKTHVAPVGGQKPERRTHDATALCLYFLYWNSWEEAQKYKGFY